MGYNNGEVIPGLPNDVAVLCLSKVPRLHHGNLRCVSWSWRAVIGSVEFYKQRKKLGLTEPWLVVVSTDCITSSHVSCSIYDLPSRQLISKVTPTCGLLQEACSEGYRVAAIEESLVFYGGKKLTSFKFNTLTRRWSRAAVMNVPRTGFASGVLDGVLYVAGGVDQRGKVERSVEAYDLQKNEWRTLRNAMPLGTEYRIESDAVLKNKLYAWCLGGPSSGVGDVVMVYDPVNDAWKDDRRMIEWRNDGAFGGELVATDESLYRLDAYDDRLCKYDFGKQVWESIDIHEDGFPNHHHGRSRRVLNSHSRRSFGAGSDLFVLTGGSYASWTHPGGSCHYLFMGSSWYRAGAVIRA